MNRARATVRVDLTGRGVDPAAVAAALAPDDTDEMKSRLDGAVLETRVERGSIGGLRSTLDDYVVNLGVAIRVAERASGSTPGHDPGRDLNVDLDSDLSANPGSNADSSPDPDPDIADERKRQE